LYQLDFFKVISFDPQTSIPSCHSVNCIDEAENLTSIWCFLL